MSNNDTHLKAGFSSLLLIFGIGAYGLFFLPYQIPLTEMVESDSYAVGCNNRIAVLAVIAVIVMFCLRGFFWQPKHLQSMEPLFRWDKDDPERPFSKMPRWIFWICATIQLAYTWFLFFYISNLRMYSEASYNMTRVVWGLKYHLHPYRDIEWAYGPALFYLPQWSIELGAYLGLPEDISYLICFSCILILMLGGVFYVVNCFRIKVHCQILIFCLCAVFLNTSLGLHYTWIRYITPFIAILLVHKTANAVVQNGKPGAFWKLYSVSFLWAVAALSVSPETGIVFCVAQCVYGIHRAWFGGRRWLGMLPATALGFLALLCLFPGCFRAVFAFSKGGGNFPILPSPFILLYVGSLWWLIPRLFRGCVSRQPSQEASLIAAWAVAVVASIPAALGRCDYGHILSNGIGCFLLTFALTAKDFLRWFYGYAVLFFMFFCTVALMDDYKRTREVLSSEAIPVVAGPSPLAKSLGLQDFPSIMMPFGREYLTEKYLIETGQFVPGYFPGFLNVHTRVDLDKKIESFKNAGVLLVPDWILNLPTMSDQDFDRWQMMILKEMDSETSSRLTFLLGYPIQFHTKNLPLYSQMMAARHIVLTYDCIRHVPGWVVMAPRNRADKASILPQP